MMHDLRHGFTCERRSIEKRQEVSSPTKGLPTSDRNATRAKLLRRSFQNTSPERQRRVSRDPSLALRACELGNATHHNEHFLSDAVEPAIRWGTASPHYCCCRSR